MRRTMLTTTMILLVAGSASAAPSCRDGKGLFTPCTGERAPLERGRHAQATVDALPHAGRPHDDKPPLVGRARLCRDGKGLFTPCGR